MPLQYQFDYFCYINIFSDFIIIQSLIAQKSVFIENIKEYWVTYFDLTNLDFNMNMQLSFDFYSNFPPSHLVSISFG